MPEIEFQPRQSFMHRICRIHLIFRKSIIKESRNINESVQITESEDQSGCLFRRIMNSSSGDSRMEICLCGPYCHLDIYQSAQSALDSGRAAHQLSVRDEDM